MGMKPSADYSLTNIIKDQFYALKGQTMECYSLFTGKYEQKHEIDKSIIDMSKLTYVDRKKNGKVLYATTAPETVTNEKEFYLPW